MATFGSALAALAALGTVEVASGAWTTAPVGGPPGQPDYLNAVVRWRPAAPWATPERALAALLAIEAGLGRQRRERWGPRTLDLDLLDGVGWAPPGRGRRGTLPSLPHPRAATRAFVLVPWAEVAPAWPAPPAEPVPASVGRLGAWVAAGTVADLARAIDRTGVRRATGATAAAWRAAVADARPDRRAAGAQVGRG